MIFIQIHTIIKMFLQILIFYIWVIDLDRSNSNQINNFAWIPLYNVKIHFNSIGTELQKTFSIQIASIQINHKFSSRSLFIHSLNLARF